MISDTTGDLSNDEWSQLPVYEGVLSRSDSWFRFPAVCENFPTYSIRTFSIEEQKTSEVSERTIGRATS